MYRNKQSQSACIFFIRISALSKMSWACVAICLPMIRDGSKHEEVCWGRPQRLVLDEWLNTNVFVFLLTCALLCLGPLPPLQGKMVSFSFRSEQVLGWRILWFPVHLSFFLVKNLFINSTPPKTPIFVCISFSTLYICHSSAPSFPQNLLFFVTRFGVM